ncbi:hypothetical protein EJK15_40330 [Nonomuraea basaltis]|nr:hypothetical protein EJK15_40330 [Nonomuraea basaltis]
MTYGVDAPTFRAERKRGTVGHLSLPVLSVAVGNLLVVSRYRLQPTLAQEAAPAEDCGHARSVWNLAVEQHEHGRPGRKSAPGFAEQCRQLTEARAEFAWLRAGSIIVQQQAARRASCPRRSGRRRGSSRRRP